MQEFQYRAIFYDRPDGTEPANEFLMSLNKKMRAKMAWTINILQVGGPEVREPYSKHLDDGIFELRAQVGADITRVLYFFLIGKRAILTHGFVKKTIRLQVRKSKRPKAIVPNF